MALRTLLRFITLPLVAALAACGGPMDATAPATTAAASSGSGSGGTGSGSGGTTTSGAGSVCIAPALCIAARNRNGAPPAGGLALLLVGTGFQADSTVTFGGVPATGVALDAATGGLVCTIPPHAEGYVDVVVANPDGQTATSAGFHYGPPPSISAFSPTTIVSKGEAVTVDGADFSATVQVIVGGTIATVSSVSATQVVFVAPKLNAGWYQLAVTNTDGQYAVGPGFLAYGSGL